MVVAVEVADHDDSAEHGHVLEDCGGELTSNSVPEDVDTVRGCDVEGLVDVLGLVVEGPVVVEVRLDPRRLLSVPSVAQNSQAENSTLKSSLKPN